VLTGAARARIENSRNAGATVASSNRNWDAMKRTGLFILAVTYAALIATITVATRPWDGGDGSIGFVLLTNVVSFPVGLLPTYVLKVVSGAAVGTRWEHAMSLSPLWWVSLGIGCGVLGYLQWAYIISRAARAFRQRVLTKRCGGP
jgi:hypothetical protein